ncbi:MAG: sigma 54-interacting transcriptional regulator [Acidobacteriota bacterium]
MHGEQEPARDPFFIQQYQALLEVAEAIVSHKDLPSLFHALSQKLHHITPYDFIGVLLHDAERNVMRLHSLETPTPILSPPPPDSSVETSPSGYVWRTQQPLFIDVESETRFPEIIALLRLQGMKALYVTPLTSVNRRLGAMGFGSKELSAYSQTHLSFLQQVARQVAVAVDNTLNFENAQIAGQQTKRQSERLRLMLKITNAMVSQLDLKELLRVISPSIREVIGNDTVGVLLYDQEINQLRAFMSNFPPQHPLAEQGFPIPFEGSPSGLAFTSGQPVYVDKPDAEKFYSDLSKRVFDEGTQSGICIPLTAKGQQLGVLGVTSKHEQAFSDEDKEFLLQVANQVSIAVDNALNFERARVAEQQAKRQSERLQLLLDLNNAIASALDLPALFRAVSACLRQVFQHDVAVMGLYNEALGELRAYALDDTANVKFLEEGMLVPLDGTPAGRAVLTKQAVILGQGDGETYDSEIVRRFIEQGFKSGCSVPLMRHDRVIGAMSIASKIEAAFSADDGDLLMQLARQIAIAVENALAYHEIDSLKNKLASEKLYLEEEIQTVFNFEEIIGQSAALKRILKQIETVAPTDSTILIQGETGTGKELIARAIHNLSNRSERTMVKLNCAAIPTGLLESELFGHEKGAFTGAIAQRIGRFELAHRGTLFLDEVGDIPLELQPKLLRVLQEQEFERLGSARTIRVDTRLIAATNCDLAQMVEEKKYRGDLFYRLNVFPIHIPPLRERPEDIKLLARFFTQKFARRMKKNIETIPGEAIAALTAYHWPGNVRELEHFIERAVILTPGAALTVSLAELKPAPQPSPATIATLETAEREHILRALEETRWVIGGPQGAAARLGMKRTTLQSRMQKLGIFRQS